jgi:hypothetical protein
LAGKAPRATAESLVDLAEDYPPDREPMGFDSRMPSFAVERSKATDREHSYFGDPHDRNEEVMADNGAGKEEAHCEWPEVQILLLFLLFFAHSYPPEKPSHSQFSLL